MDSRSQLKDFTHAVRNLLDLQPGSFSVQWFCANSRGVDGNTPTDRESYPVHDSHPGQLVLGSSTLCGPWKVKSDGTNRRLHD